MNGTTARQLRALLALSRVSHLPTVWSNCLAGWWLGGHGNFAKLPFLFLGVSALYTGGMFLNDAFDADFDRQRRAERPIPSGAISLPAVWGWGLGWLGLGTLCLTAVGRTTGFLALVLLLCIIIYDATHKVVTASPWLMGVCRFWVYVIAGSAGAAGVSGGPIWCGVALALYVAGMGSLAQHESSRGQVPYWPLALLLAPVVLALIMNSAALRDPGHVAVARAGLMDGPLCADDFSGRRGQCWPHGVGSAGGNCLCGLAGRCAALPAMAEHHVLDVYLA